LGEVADPGMVLSRAAQADVFTGTRLLTYLVPWGDAVFNQAQADLESDIGDLKRTKCDPQVVARLKAIEPLVSRLSNETHVCQHRSLDWEKARGSTPSRSHSSENSDGHHRSVRCRAG
jgi:hypothetical protein